MYKVSILMENKLGFGHFCWFSRLPDLVFSISMFKLWMYAILRDKLYNYSDIPLLGLLSLPGMGETPDWVHIFFHKTLQYLQSFIYMVKWLNTVITKYFLILPPLIFYFVSLYWSLIKKRHPMSYQSFQRDYKPQAFRTFFNNLK